MTDFKADGSLAADRKTARINHTLLRSTSHLGLLAAASFAIAPSPALAQCDADAIDPDTYVCDGDNSVPQILAGSALQVTTNAGFSVDTPLDTGSALTMIGDNSVSYIDDNQSELTHEIGAALFARTLAGGTGSIIISTGGMISGTEGVVIDQAAAGSVTATFTGTITATDDEGLVVTRTSAVATGSDDLSLTVADVRAQDTAILIDNQGFGSTHITATGLIEAADPDNGNGLDVTTGSNTGDLTIALSDVIAAKVGLDIDHRGTGELSLTTGDVVAIGDSGIRVISLADADATFSIGSIQAGRNGFSMVMNGAGAVEFTATGAVAGDTGTGIIIGSNDDITRLSVDVGDVTGGFGGIELSNSGTGEISLTSSGKITGETSDAIIAANGSFSTTLKIDVTDVEGAANGIVATNSGDGETIIRASGRVSGGTQRGISVVSGGLTSITTVEVNSVSAGTDAIAVTHNGEGVANVSASGPIIAGRDGVTVENGLQSTGITVNIKDVDAGNDGVNAVQSGSSAMLIQAEGMINAGGDGIVAAAGTSSNGIKINAENIAAQGSGIKVSNAGSGSSIIATTGSVSGQSGKGIDVTNTESASFLQIDTVDVSAGEEAILTNNYGANDTLVRSTGNITGGGLAAVAVINHALANGLTIKANNVDAVTNGIVATNLGIGVTSIEAEGHINAGDRGIIVNTGPNTTDLSVTVNSVTSKRSGIAVNNTGTGQTIISANGLISAGTSGISARTGESATSLAIDVASIEAGDGNAILVDHNGSGAVTVKSTGNLGAASGSFGVNLLARASSGDISLDLNTSDSVRVVNEGTGDVSLDASGSIAGAIGIFNGDTSGSVSLNVQDVLGGATAINVQATGTGGIDLIANGAVSGADTGINLINKTSSATDVSATVTDVSGGQTGIVLSNFGAGKVSLTASGTISGGETGARIIALAGAGDMSVTTGAVTAGAIGLSLENSGLGTTTLLATGPVTGSQIDGIFAQAEATSGAMSISATDVSGGEHGIHAINLGNGGTDISISGAVTGGIAAIDVASGGSVAITLGGSTSNASGASSDLAISADSSATVVTNSGELTGRIALGDGNDQFVNAKIWHVTGANEFGGGADMLTTLAGSQINAASQLATAETTSFDGLQQMVAAGHVSLADGGVGDVLHVSGDVAFKAGSALAVDIGGAVGSADLFSADGVVQIEEGASILVNITSPLVRGEQHEVVRAKGGLTGEFAFAGTTTTAFLQVTSSYDANSLFIGIEQYRAFADAALTFNQAQTAAALDQLPVGELTDALGNLTDDASARTAFDLLSGEIHASLSATLIEDSRFVREAVLDRTSFDDRSDVARNSVWGSLYAGQRDQAGNGNAAGSDGSVSGMLIGADRPIGDALRIGAVAGYARHNLDVDGRQSKAQSDEKMLGIYANGNIGNAGLSAGAIHSWHSVDTDRLVTFGTFSQQASADYDASAMQAFGEASYGLKIADIDVTPFASVAYVRVKSDNITENGGSAALNSTGHTTDALFGNVGARFVKPFSLGRNSARVHGLVGWRHTLTSDETLARNGFVAGGESFQVMGTNIVADTVAVEAGMDAFISDRIRIGVSYTGNLGSNNDSHGLRLGVGMAF